MAAPIVVTALPCGKLELNNMAAHVCSFDADKRPETCAKTSPNTEQETLFGNENRNSNKTITNLADPTLQLLKFDSILH